MEPSTAAPRRESEVTVNFVRDGDQVPEPKALVATTDEHGRAPRNKGSRRIEFIDDGKLFEGHFTVQSTNLKSIIQYLLDRHSEQDVIIRDLQKQVLTLRARSLKSSKRSQDGALGAALASANNISSGGGGGGAGVSSDVLKRLKRVEQFLQLWGVRPSDLAELVDAYGDPTITPDAYTSYLLDLPAFRLTRREARALVGSGAASSAASGGVIEMSDTAARRRTSSSRREASSSSGAAAAASTDGKARHDAAEHRTRSPGPGDDAATSTLDRATAALEKAEQLLGELRTVAARGAPAPKPRRAEPASRGAAGGGAVDVEARADLDELSDYVMQRFEELEARAAVAARQSGEAARARDAAAKRSAGSPPVPPPLQPRAAASSTSRGGEEVVDAIAREDAAASLDLLEELESTMERRFRDLNNAVASLTARTAAMTKGGGAGGGDGERPQRRSVSPAGPAPAREALGSGAVEAEERRLSASNSRSSSVPAKRTTTPKQKARAEPSEGVALVSAPPAVLVDQAARDETVALSERVNDLEEELLERWQAMEERLRIIGRAAMKQGVTNAAGPQSMSRAPAVDRKAREDAALSLMRLQQVEKELAALRRQSTAARGGSGGSRAEGGAAIVLPVVVAEAAESGMPLRDTYGSKVADLEREVEQRMAEVNNAIAQLRGVGGSYTPLVLSPHKGTAGREAAVATPLPQAAQGTVSSALATPVDGQLTLHAEDAVRVAHLPASAASGRTPAEENRRAAQQAILHLGYDIDADSNLFADLSRSGVRVGGRRTTISRLRSPDAPPFGTHLVQREEVDVAVIAAAAAAAVSAARDTEPLQGPAAPPARRVSNVKGELTQAERHAHSPSPPRGSKVGGGALSHVSVL